MTVKKTSDFLCPTIHTVTLSATLKTLNRTHYMILKLKIIIFLTILCSIVYSQKKTIENVWIIDTVSVNKEFRIQFEYPQSLKFDRIENCCSFGTESKSTEYNNTMDWGIWMTEPQNFIEPDSIYFKELYNDDFSIKREPVLVSNFKAERTVCKQTIGDKYYEIIILKFEDCIFEITNSNAESVDFERFWKSIKIEK